jgi:hypothetical protein
MRRVSWKKDLGSMLLGTMSRNQSVQAGEGNKRIQINKFFSLRRTAFKRSLWD